MITIPTIKQLADGIIADIESEFGITLPTLGKNFLRILARVQAAKLKMFYLAVANVQKNMFIDTADSEYKGGTLERYGRVKLGRNPFTAIAGVYDVIVTGEVGAVIDAETTFKSNDDSTNPGYLFILDAEFTLTATTDTIRLRALTSGLDSALEVGDNLTATQPIPNVDKSAEIDSITTDPEDAEDIESYREKGIEAFQLEPQGGAGSDYRLWAADAQGVEKVYPYAGVITNEVDLYVEATKAASSDGFGTPDAQLLLDVEDVVNQDPDDTKPDNERGRRPLNVVVNYIAVSALPVDVTITGGSFTASEQTSINDALGILMDGIRPFVASTDSLENKNDILDINRIINTILTVKPGAVFGTVTMTVNGNSVTTYTFEDGEIPYKDDVNYA